METILYCLRISWEASRTYTILRLLGATLPALLSIATSFLVKYLLDTLTGGLGSALAHSLYLLAAMLCVKLLAAAFDKSSEYAQTLHDEMVQHVMTSKFHDKAMRVDLEQYDNPEYYNRCVKALGDTFYFGIVVWNVFTATAMAIVAAMALLSLSQANWLYGMLIFLAAVPAAIVTQKYSKLLFSFEQEQMTYQRELGYYHSLAIEKQHAQDIRMYGLRSHIQSRYKNLFATVFGQKRAIIKKRAFLSSVLEFLPEIVLLGISVDIVVRITTGKASIGDYTLYTSLGAQLSAALIACIVNLMKIYDSQLRIESARSFLALENKIPDEGKRILQTVESVEFKQVGFSYETGKQVLKDVNFRLDKGKALALVGLNGTGKTTLIKLLLRFYLPDTGQILVNGHEISEYSLESYRAAFGTYFQNTENFAFTLRENVAFSNLDNARDDDAIKNAILQADAQAIFKKAGGDLDTYIFKVFDENGLQLSGGEGQKLALARALFRPAQVVVLDEPSSSLDPQAESRFFDSLLNMRKGRTTLFTSHRLSNLHDADLIMVLEDGMIQESGTMEELLNLEGSFSKLYHLQADRYKVE